MIARLLRTAFSEAWTRRGSFWFQVGLMIANDLALVAFWFLFFNRVDEVKGWDVARTLTLLAILATVAGVGMGLCANARRLGDIVSSGELDAVLPLPVDPLGYLLVRRVDTAPLGDIVVGPALFAMFGQPTLERTALYLLGCVCGTVVFVSFLVMLGSVTFFAGGRGEHSELGFQTLLIFASYPLDVFGGFTKIVLFTAVPAAFVTGVPVQLVEHFSWWRALGLVGAALASAAAGRGLFEAGLRRYRSGALWTRA